VDVIGSRQQILGAEMSEAEDIWHVVDVLVSVINGEKAIWLSGIDSRSGVRSSALSTVYRYIQLPGRSN